MTAVITGLGLGLERGSGSILGASGQLGQAGVGQADNDVVVNAGNGNLVVQATDQVLIGLGLDAAVTRTYNSQGSLSDNNGALWSDAFSRHVITSSLTGTLDTAGSTIQRVAADGSVVTYTWSTSASAYVANEGGGANDTLTYNGSAQTWTWTDGATQDTDVYDATHAGRIISSSDATGLNSLTYTYNTSGYLTNIETAEVWPSGLEGLNIQYNSSNQISSISTINQDSGGDVWYDTYIYYGYTGSNLTSATTDLTPGDGSITDGNVYTTTYGYSGSTSTLTSVTQSDGSSAVIAYDGSGRVASVTDALASGASDATNFTYTAGSTAVTDQGGNVTTLNYNSSDELTSLVTPLSQTSSFTYDSMGDVLTATAANGDVNTYTYDVNGNRLSDTDSLGDTTINTYSFRNLLLTSSTYPTSGGSPLTTSYFYNSSNELTYMVSPKGEITQYLYAGAPGEVTSTIDYPSITASPPLAGTISAQAGTGANTINLGLLGGAATSISLTSTTTPHGTLTLSGTTVTYTPTSGYTGADSFTYTATNSFGTSSTGTVNLTVVSGTPTPQPSLVVPALTTAELNAWTGATWDQSGVVRTDTAYNTRGQVSGITRYSTATTAGAGSTVASTINYTYDSVGDLLTRQISGFGVDIDDTYDGLGRIATTTNIIGWLTTYAYANTSSGHTVTVTNTLSGSVTASAYNLADELVSTTVTASNAPTATTTYAYNDLGQLRMVTDPAGVATYYVYDADGRKVADVGDDGSITTYAYNVDNQLTETVQHANLLTSSQLSLLSVTGYPAPVALSSVLPTASSSDRYSYSVYDTAGRLAETIDASGAAVVYTYDQASRLTSTTAYANLINATTLSGFASAPPTSVVTPTASPGNDRVTTFAYDNDGQLTQTVANSGGLNLTTTNTYDGFGNVVAVTDPDGNITRNVYNNDNQLTYTIDGAGDVTYMTYDGKNDLLSKTSYVTALSPSVLAALPLQVSVATISADVTTSTFDTTSVNYYSSIEYYYETVLNGGTLTPYQQAQDQVGDIIVTDDATPVSTFYAYDGDGKVIYTVNPDGDVTQNTYNADGQVVSVTSYATLYSGTMTPSGAWVGLSPAGFASLIASGVATSSNDETSHNVYNGNGQLAYTINAAGQPTEYDYDSNGRLVQTIQYAGTISPTSYTYSAIQTLVAGLAGLSANRITRSVYNADGQLAYAINADGDVTGYSYDAFGNMVQERQFATVFTGSGVQTLSAMQSWQASNSTTSDRVDRLVYDGAGRLEFSIDGAGDVTQTTYDADGNVVATRAYATALTTTQLGALPTVATVANVLADVTTSSSDQISRSVYDAAGRQIYDIDAAGDVVQTVYDGQNHVVATRAFNTPLSPTVLGALPLAVSATTIAADVTASTSDEITRFAYNALGRLVLVVDAVGGVTAYAYNADSNVVTKRVYATGLSPSVLASLPLMTTTATIRSYLTASSSDEVTTYTYDADQRLLTTTDALGGVTTNQYDAFGNLVKTTDARGNSGYFYYNSLNQLVLEVDPDGYATATTYSLGGQVTQVTRYQTATTGASVTTRPTLSGPTEVTSIGRDNMDRITSNTDANSYSESYVLNAFGAQTQVTNQLGGVTTNTYDTRGLLLTTVLSETSTESTGAVEATSVTNTNTYDAFGNLRTQVKASGLIEQETTTYTYDALDRQVSQSGDAAYTVSPTGAWATASPTSTTTYDAYGNVIEQVDADGDQTFYYHDALNRKIDEISAVGQLSSWSYNAFSDATVARVYGTTVTLPTSPGGAPPTAPSTYRETDTTYDLDNRATGTSIAGVLVGGYNTSTSTYSASTQTIATQTTYDADGNVIETIDADGNKTFNYYDAAGRRIAQVDPDNYLTTYTLDDEGNALTEHQYATAITGTVTTGTPPTGTTSASDRITTFTYDKDGQRLTETRDNVAASTVSSSGALSTSTVNATVTYTYNGLGEVTSQTQATGDYTDYYYDNQGRQTEVRTTPYIDYTGTSVTPDTLYYYDGLNNLTRTTVGAVGWAASADEVTTNTYGADGRLAASTDASGFTENYYYDADGNVRYQTYTQVMSNGSSITQYSLTGYDADNRVVETLNFNATTAVAGDISYTNYDAYGEVVSKAINGVTNTTYGYDAAGYLTSSTANGGVQAFYVNDADGRATLEIDSTGANFSGQTVASVMSADITNGQADTADISTLTTTISVYDGRGAALQSITPERQISALTSYTTVSGDTLATIAYAKLGSPLLWFMIANANGLSLSLGSGYAPTSGTVLNIPDALTTSTTRVYDAFGDVVSNTDPNLYTTTYSYNTLGDQTQEVEPTVNSTNAAGGVSSINPTLNYDYDVSGRMVGSETANGYWTTRSLLAGTGYNGGTASALTTFYPDATTTKTGYDVFGNARVMINQLNNLEIRAYDGMNRLINDTVQYVADASYTTVSGNTLGSIAAAKLGSSSLWYLIADANGLSLSLGSTYAPTTGTVLNIPDVPTTTTSSYTTVSGDTLSSIAAAQLGSFTLWHVIAQANGLSASIGPTTVLTAGTVLTIPKLVTNTATNLTTSYAYDGLGEQIQQWNSQFGASVKETTDYDLEGRVISTVDYAGHATTYAYAWSNTLATTGLGTFGGWVKTEVNSTGLTETTDEDAFGRTVGMTDFGGFTYTYTYDDGGRLISQTNSDFQNLTNTYYNTGQIASTSDSYTWGSSIFTISLATSSYTYDTQGNRLTEVYAGSYYNPFASCFGLPNQVATPLENAVATYDALGRMIKETDTGENGTHPLTVNYAYDADGNIRNMATTYDDAVSGSSTGQNYWYLYDSMDRFVITQGTMTGTLGSGTITTGTTGTAIVYDAAGERISATSNLPETTSGTCGPYSWTDTHIETFSYTPDGYLAATSISDGAFNPITSVYTQNPAYTAAVDTRDALGRVTAYIEYSSAGVTAFSSTTSFNNDNLETSETDHTVISTGATVTTTTTYDYDLLSGSTYTGAYMGGQVVHTHSTSSITSGTAPPTTDTVNTYGWGTTSYETAIAYTPNTASPGTVYHSTFDYDSNGHLLGVYIADGAPRTITYATTSTGQVMMRTVASGASTNPSEEYYYFNGNQIGDIGNNGTSETDYAQAIANRSAAGGTGPFLGGATTATDYAAFGDSYVPIDPTSAGSATSANTTYTVQAGDSLQSIANSLWGDSSLWYLIADANGLSGSQSLNPGMTLVVPSKVTNVHNNAATFTVYDPSKAIGDVQPNTPAPPPQPKHGGCGGIGAILVAIVAIVVVAIVAPYAEAALANVFGGATLTASGAGSLALGTGLAGATATTAGVVTSVTAASISAGFVSVGLGATIVGGAIAGIAGSVASQLFGLATGNQSQFSWSGVALAALSGGISGGLTGELPNSDFENDAIAGGMARGAIGSAVTQGVAVATGLQSKFDWTSVAEAGVMGGVTAAVTEAETPPGHTPSLITQAVAGTAGAIAGAAAGTLISGRDFGSTLEQLLPSVIGQTIGTLITDKDALQPTDNSSANSSTSPADDSGQGDSSAPPSFNILNKGVQALTDLIIGTKEFAFGLVMAPLNFLDGLTFGFINGYNSHPNDSISQRLGSALEGGITDGPGIAFHDFLQSFHTALAPAEFLARNFNNTNLTIPESLSDLVGEIPLVGHFLTGGNTPDVPQSGNTVTVISQGIHGYGVTADVIRNAGLNEGVRDDVGSGAVIQATYPYGTIFDVGFSLLGLSNGYAYDAAQEILDQGVKAGDTVDFVGHSGGVQRLAMAARILGDVGVYGDDLVGIAGPVMGSYNNLNAIGLVGSTGLIEPTSDLQYITHGLVSAGGSSANVSYDDLTYNGQTIAHIPPNPNRPQDGPYFDYLDKYLKH